MMTHLPKSEDGPRRTDRKKRRRRLVRRLRLPVLIALIRVIIDWLLDQS